ncbi:MAG: hypothetical protein ACLR6J_11105 [Parabacteroides merdae]
MHRPACAEYYRVMVTCGSGYQTVRKLKIPVKTDLPCRLELPTCRLQLYPRQLRARLPLSSLTEKYARKDIGGVGVPEQKRNAEKGVNAELGFKNRDISSEPDGILRLGDFTSGYRHDRIPARNPHDFSVLSTVCATS